MALTKLNFSGQPTLPSAKMPTGSVLQVIHSEMDGADSATAVGSLTSYTDTGLSVSITPSSTSSKILVFVSTNIGASHSSSTTAARYDLRLVNNDASATAYESRYVGTDYQGSGNLSVHDTFHGYFSPSSTSSQTYKVQTRVAGGSTDQATSLYLKWYGGAKHTITAMEIVG